MKYYEILGLSKEPFSMAPDPEFFYYSGVHNQCLERLEISLRMNRGLNIVVGGIGTGKTTLSRLLIGRFVEFDENFQFFLILDPTWKDTYEFLHYLSNLFGIKQDSTLQVDMMDKIEHYLIDMATKENQHIVLMIDEGQKMGSNQLEIVRTLLNFETNNSKLIQVIIFAQPEFKETLEAHDNFKDRVSFGYTIQPLSFEESIKLIKHRLKIAGLKKKQTIFSDGSLKIIYEITKGFPRKIVTLCHQLIVDNILAGKETVQAEDVYDRIKEGNPYSV